MSSSSKPRGVTTVMVSGNFNILHPGHIRLLNFAASCGEKLIILLFENNAKTFVDLSDRKNALSSLNIVNKVIVLKRENLCEEITKLKPDTIVKGREFSVLTNPEKNIVESYGGRLLFGSGEVQFSSKDLLNKQFLSNKAVGINIPSNFIEEHNLSLQ